MTPSFCTTEMENDLFLGTVSPMALLTSLIFPLVVSFLGWSFPGYSVAPLMEAFPDLYLPPLSFSVPLPALLKPFWDGGHNHTECSRAGWTREMPRAVLASSGLQLLSWLIPTVIFAFWDRCWALSWCFHATGCHGPGPSSWVGMVSSDPSILHVRLRLLFLTCITSHSPILNFIFMQVSQEATANLHTQPSSSIGLINLKLALLSTPSLSLVTSERAEQTQLPPTSAKCQDPFTRKACYLLQPPLFIF